MAWPEFIQIDKSNRDRQLGPIAVNPDHVMWIAPSRSADDDHEMTEICWASGFGTTVVDCPYARVRNWLGRNRVVEVAQ